MSGCCRANHRGSSFAPHRLTKFANSFVRLCVELEEREEANLISWAQIVNDCRRGDLVIHYERAHPVEGRR